jgi:hypothetical protein
MKSIPLILSPRRETKNSSVRTPNPNVRYSGAEFIRDLDLGR